MPTRRRFVATTAAAALATACTGKTPMKAPASRQFPKDFAWGTATAAYQIEGARDADGRGKSIWDTFDAIPGKIRDGTDAAIGCDSYRRYADDAQLIADGGIKHYRFSIAWPRVVPSGEGAANEKGLDYYRRLVDALLERGVTPWATLFHWDLPQALEDKGGWKNRETAQRLADYAGIVGKALGDRLKNFIVLNEAAVHAVLGHVLGQHAPGHADIDSFAGAIHHQNLSQGLAMQALRAAVADARLGTTLALQPCRPEGEFPQNLIASQGLDEIWNGGFLDPVLKGSYPKTALDIVGKLVKPGDLEITKQPVDFIGVNYYSPIYVKLDLSSPARIGFGRTPKDRPRDAFGREIDPSGLHEILLRLKTNYGDPLLYITENGCSDPFSTNPAVIDDAFRIAYLRQHLEAVLAAREAGANVAGFFHWSLIDNFEWTLGFTSKFGLVAMNRDTGVRTPKASYAWYAALAKSGVLDSVA